MATSETAIANLALAKIGTRSTIASLTEDSNEAINCNLFYAETRDEVQTMADWNFTHKTETLALYKSAPGTPSNPTGATEWSNAFPAPPWLYEYLYPADCLQIQWLIPQINTGVIGTPIFSNNAGMYPYVMGPAVKFRIATDTDATGAQINVVLTNQYQAIAAYTKRITNVNLFSPAFIEALACALAAKIAMPLTGDKDLVQKMYGLANQKIIDARASDGNEGLTVLNPQADWITCREGGGNDGFGWWVAPYSPLYTVTG